jgi:hypothetical protein
VFDAENFSFGIILIQGRYYLKTDPEGTNIVLTEKFGPNHLN